MGHRLSNAQGSEMELAERARWRPRARISMTARPLIGATRLQIARTPNLQHAEWRPWACAAVESLNSCEAVSDLRHTGRLAFLNPNGAAGGLSAERAAVSAVRAGTRAAHVPRVLAVERGRWRCSMRPYRFTRSGLRRLKMYAGTVAWCSAAGALAHARRMRQSRSTPWSDTARSAHCSWGCVRRRRRRGSVEHGE
jgi:hypothetical protein